MVRSKILAAAAALAMLAGAAQAQPARPANQCFFINQFQGWRAPDAKTIYIRVGVNDIYRLDLATACNDLLFPDSHLITKTRGPDTVCSAVDWDLSVAQTGPGSIPTPCIVKSMRKLTPAEAAAIPRKFRP